MLEVTNDSRGVVTVTLDRPEVHNALNADLIAGLHGVAQRLSSDDSVRVVILTARGRSFCAGGDLRWMQDQMAATPSARAAQARALADMLGAWNRLPKPVIARVGGPAYGGGVGLCAVSDVVVATETAKFALTETRLGLIPATIGPYVMARMHPAALRRYFYSGQTFGAEAAREAGLVSVVATQDTLDAAVEAEVGSYLKCAPGAVAAAKALTQAHGVTQDQIDQSITALIARWESAEAGAGLSAFFAKDRPPWQS